MIREWLDRRRVRVTAHRAQTSTEDGTSVPMLCINVTNKGRRDVEVTHVWIASSPPVYFENEHRSLPRRLIDQEAWTTWVVLGQETASIRLDETMARVRLSTGTVLSASIESTMPPVGAVAGAQPRAKIRAIG